MQLGSSVPVAVEQAGSFSSNSTLRCVTSVCDRCGQRKKEVSNCEHYGLLIFPRFFLPILFFFLFVCFLAPRVAHGRSKVRGPIRAEPQQMAYTTATAMSDLSHICDLHHSSQQCWILTPLSRAGVLMDTSQVHYCWATTGAPA